MIGANLWTLSAFGTFIVYLVLLVAGIARSLKGT